MLCSEIRFSTMPMRLEGASRRAALRATSVSLTPANGPAIVAYASCAFRDLELDQQAAQVALVARASVPYSSSARSGRVQLQAGRRARRCFFSTSVDSFFRLRPSQSAVAPSTASRSFGRVFDVLVDVEEDRGLPRTGRASRRGGAMKA